MGKIGVHTEVVAFVGAQRFDRSDASQLWEAAVQKNRNVQPNQIQQGPQPLTLSVVETHLA